MPPVKELSALQVKRLTEPGFYGVGGATGLYLKIAPGGSKSWILRATVGSKRRDIGLGGFPDVPLSRARELARESREQIKEGIDPAERRKANRQLLAKAQAMEMSFSEAAIKCHQSKSTEFRSAKHRKDWINSLEIHVFPLIGKT